MLARSSFRVVRRLLGVVIAGALLTLPASPAGARGHGPGQGGGHMAVYTQTQDPAGNQIVVYTRAADGMLAEKARVSTGGVGAVGTPPFDFSILDASGGVELTADGQLLFAVNAGDDTISSFRVRPNGGLRLVDVEPSGGDLPVSLDSRGKLLYALNEGSGDISGFRFTAAGEMTPIPGSTRALSTTGVEGLAAQVGFAAHARVLTVTLRGPSVIDTFRLDAGDKPGPAIPNAANALTPFGFEYRNDDTLIVANVGEVGDPADTTMFHGTASSYDLTPQAGLTPIDLVDIGQRGTCWVVLTNDERYAYMTNTLSGSVSRFRIARDGDLSLLGHTATGPGFPSDEASSVNSRYLYVLLPSILGGMSHIDIYRQRNGALTHIGATPSNLPAGVSGLAAR